MTENGQELNEIQQAHRCKQCCKVDIIRTKINVASNNNVQKLSINQHSTNKKKTAQPRDE
ncbi:hypothetical protein T03_17910 [Trichinella britovi]|uniref:Uncharacterized protein n=1 Tax=Trichinella britovi TaxID=45882 RepID=A0A0V1DB49_TRIBR|nr:hypothetical protein T09_11686 [Trichinella sp. T9]KRY58687.1 hypothetical protein T03_17910 [Trichinella britovi]KRZ93574.1 hypothetical protein T08_5220 [Trichinella sp. T8]